MKIKKLELFGFKSFVDKTVLNFDHDVLGIVGPNGCGKSNIVDAIRWCMGEQSAKHLRGRSMEDVLFNGSEVRGPSEYAEVTLTFENDQPDELPLEFKDFAEIAVTRRLHRSGDSEYLVNKTPVRLKDITDLFLGTGVGTKAYSIVEQGKIGLIVSAKPEDRRMLIEEAAGITKFKSRKKQAERKMEQTELNLLRVGDIVAEIERNLGTLKRQAAKAERFVAYRSELEDLQLYEASHRYLEHWSWVRKQDSEVIRVTGSSQEAKAQLEASEAEFEVLREQASALEATLEAAQSAHFTAENALRAEQASVARVRDRVEALRSRELQAGAELETLLSEQATLQSEEAELRAKFEIVNADGDTAAERLRQEHEKLSELEASLQQAERTTEQLRSSAAQASTEIATAQAKLESFSAHKTELEDRIARLDFEAEDLGEQQHELEQRSQRLQGEQEERRQLQAGAREELSAAEATLATLRQALRESEQEVEAARGEAHKQRSRLGALKELAERLDGVGQGAKELLTQGDSALLGLVADVLEAPSDLTVAVAAVLGSRVEHVVVRDLDRGLQLLAQLSEHGQGRATLVPECLPFVAGGGPVPEQPGVLGALADHVRCAPEHEGLVRRLLGHAVLVEDAEQARRLRDQYRVTTVTRDGLVFADDGSVHGGAGGGGLAEGMLDTKREIRELELSVTEQDAQVSTALARHQALRAELEAVQTALEAARKLAHDAELACLSLDKDRARAESERSQLATRLDNGKKEHEKLTLKLEEAERERASLEQRAERARETLEASAADLAHAESAAESVREAVLSQRTVETEHRVLAAGAKERLDSVRGALHRIERSSQELTMRAERLQRELGDLARQLGESFGNWFALEERIASGSIEAAQANLALAEAKQQFELHRQRQGECEHSLRGLRGLVTELREELGQHEMVLKEHQLALSHLVSNTAERFRGLELHTVISEHHMKEAPGDDTRARIHELSQLLERMGSVNLDAMKEHAEAEERYTYYSGQKADLDQAMLDLRQAIEQMNKESKRLFRETFDAINEKFQTIFPKMFRGGRASLRLTNPDDLLETGIDILAQPPGKKIASIELMSGGEKALTAVSLIFAIFQIKPSPFCILDEVDAPLDEANVARYNEMIREMTDRSQFILITHIKRTMQMVDVLYGVTMQESGVSRLVSVKMQNAAERSARPPQTVQAVA